MRTLFMWVFILSIINLCASIVNVVRHVNKTEFVNNAILVGTCIGVILRLAADALPIIACSIYLWA